MTPVIGACVGCGTGGAVGTGGCVGMEVGAAVGVGIGAFVGAIVGLTSAFVAAGVRCTAPTGVAVGAIVEEDMLVFSNPEPDVFPTV